MGVRPVGGGQGRQEGINQAPGHQEHMGDAFAPEGFQEVVVSSTRAYLIRIRSLLRLRIIRKYEKIRSQPQ